MKKIYLIGGGGHCVSVIDVIEHGKEFQIAGIFDHPAQIGKSILDYKIIGSDEDLIKYISPDVCFLITVGQIKTAEVRKRIYSQLRNLKANLATVISPRAHVSRHAVIGEGSIVMHDALVNAGARVGINCIINTKALIEHEAVIQDHVHVATAAVVNGQCQVGGGSFIGSQSVLQQNTQVPVGSLIQAGSFFRGVQ